MPGALRWLMGPQTLTRHSQESSRRAELGMQGMPPRQHRVRGDRQGKKEPSTAQGTRAGRGGAGRGGAALQGVGGASSWWAGPGSSSQPCSPCCPWPGSPDSTPPQAPLHSLTGSLQSDLWDSPHTDSGWGRCRGPGLRSGPRSRLGQAGSRVAGSRPGPLHRLLETGQGQRPPPSPPTSR